MKPEAWNESGGNPLGLDYAEYLLIWCLRRLMMHQGDACPLVKR
jgi:hypothetical protein